MSTYTLRRAAIACLATFASLLLVLQPGPASAAPTWLTPGNVLSDTTRDAADVHVAVSPGGHTMVVWREQVGATYVVRMTERKPGGVWAAPVQLWSGPQLAFTLQAVVNDAGAAAVAFTTAGNGKARVRATIRSSYTADWPATHGVGADPWDTTSPDLAMGPGGEAVLAYVVDTGADKRIGVATGTDFDSWQQRLLTGAVANVGGPQVAVDGAGSPTVAWNAVVGGQTAASTSSRLADGSWSSPAPLAIGSSELCDLVTSGKGDVVMLWRRSNGQTYRLFLRTRSSGGAWGSSIQITDDIASPSQLRLAVDAAGRGTVTFLSWNGVGFETLAMSQETDGHWTGPLNLSTPGPSALAPEVVVDGAGIVTVVWMTTNGSAAFLVARSRPPGGAWGPTATIGPAHVSIYANGSAAADRSGNVLAAWEGPGAHTVTTLVALDGAGPGLGLPAVPARVYAGKAAALSVAQPDDAWSQVTVSWNFGDGASAAGLTAGHTWTKPGSYPVTVTATDAVGNTASTSAAVHVIGRPRVSKLKLSQAQLHLRGAGQDRTKLSFWLDTDAKLVARVRSLSPDHVGVKLVRQHLTAGRHRLILRTTMKGVQLPVGAYRVTLVASNPAGKGKAKTVRLTVVHS